MIIQYTKQAQKDLKRLPRNEREKIIDKINILADDSSTLANNIKQLQGLEETYSLRVGQYRVIYSQDGVILSVIHIGVRGEIYRRLV